MCRSISICNLIALIVLTPGTLRADEVPTSLEEVLKRPLSLQKAIQEVEPSIVCILVSRSEAYRKLQPASVADAPGQLGSYDPKKLEKEYPGSADRRREIKKLDLSDSNNVPESYGSGVVIDEKGLILTNYHVVRDATKIYVRLPSDKGKGSYADIHAADHRSDLAVLRLLDVPKPLKAIKFGDGDKIAKGQLVLSIANPFAAGFQDGSPSASWGIVSNLRRRAPGPAKEEDRQKPGWNQKATLHQFGTLVQTDARLNLGCSGGALIDLKGELIGLTTATAALSGVETSGGFAIPMNAGMRRIVNVLKRGEEVEYGFLGVGPTDGNRDDGVEIGHVGPGSPAARAGLHGREFGRRSGDIIVAVNDTPVKEKDDLFLALGTYLAGSEVEIKLKSPERTVKVVLAKYFITGKSIASSMPAPVRGLRVDYTSLLSQIVAGTTIPNGVVIREVVPNSPAETAQLKQYEVITHVNGRPIHTPAEFYREAGQVKGPLELTLLVEQGQAPRKVKVN